MTVQTTRAGSAGVPGVPRRISGHRGVGRQHCVALGENGELPGYSEVHHIHSRDYKYRSRLEATLGPLCRREQRPTLICIAADCVFLAPNGSFSHRTAPWIARVAEVRGRQTRTRRQGGGPQQNTSYDNKVAPYQTEENATTHLTWICINMAAPSDEVLSLCCAKPVQWASSCFGKAADAPNGWVKA